MTATGLIPSYPEFTDITLEMRPVLHPWLSGLETGVSECSFAELYLFRGIYGYRVSALPGTGSYVFSGADGEGGFFMLFSGLPEGDVLDDLFARFGSMRAATAAQASELESRGLRAEEDRDNFDYLYRRDEMERLSGRRFHRKKNLVNYFRGHYDYEGRPLADEYIPGALSVLERWGEGRDDPGDYGPAREALERCGELHLCGGIYYVDGEPSAYTLGEELAPEVFVIHFEKAVEGVKGLYQFIFQSFASILPEKYVYINREQDLGEPGLRKAKMSYHPAGFVEKFRVARP